jgi:acyl-CoA reductase-like NAD-dependent aldehyde dehydrogenase
MRLPGGVFNMIFGTDIGAELVRHPAIQAVGFTGSLTGVRRCISWRSSARSQSRCLRKCRRLTR